jgi:hypothetical protein
MRFLVSLLALGCSSPALSVGADLELEEPTKIAIDAWNPALERGPCPVVLYWRFDSGADVFVSYGEPRHGRRAQHDDNSILVRRDIDPSQLAMAISHELGHALGMRDNEHATDERELMFHAQPERTSPEPTGWDVAWVCAGR